ncbi:MAG: 3-methyl-2-oxobutanoate hydroxymethyltransferase [Candidatus Hadarchaeota archaeon]
MERVTTASLREMKRRGERIVMVSTYDSLTAKMVDEAEVDIILVGDSLANVILGHPDTLSVTMDEMVHHTKAVSHAAKRALVVGDMPFMSYHASPEDAIKNAGRFLKEGRAQAVKVEGGRGVMQKIEAIIHSGIPVMGHLGLTPQWIHQFGGYKVRGGTAASARAIVEDAVSLEKLGVFSLVLECVPWQLAKTITKKLDIPTIGCGAGPFCDGQVLVLHDIVGLTGATPKFVKRYAELGAPMKKAIAAFRKDVKTGKFPTMEHSYEMPAEEARGLSRAKKRRRA